MTDTEKLIVLGLLILWAGLLFGGFFVGRYPQNKEHRIPRPARIGSSLALVFVAWAWWLIVADRWAYGPLALLTAGGMTLSFVGDVFMARLIPTRHYVLGGIAFFSLAHISYAMGFLSFAGTYFVIDGAFWLPSLVMLAVGALSWAAVVQHRQTIDPLRLVALPYSLLLSLTAGLALGLALNAAPTGVTPDQLDADGLPVFPSFTRVAIGALLFLFSDLILAAQLFRRVHFPSIGDLIWLTYGPGQMLIVSGLALQAVF